MTRANAPVHDRPTALFKYKDLSGDGITHVEDTLRNSQIWFSSPLKFNDRFDCRRVYDVRNTREEIVFRKAAFLAKRNGLGMAEALAAADTEIPVESADVEHWQERQLEGHSLQLANSGILCLTPFYDSFTMWSYYASYHTGICIQFRVQSIQADEQLDFIAAAHQVEYSDRCP